MLPCSELRTTPRRVALAAVVFGGIVLGDGRGRIVGGADSFPVRRLRVHDREAQRVHALLGNVLGFALGGPRKTVLAQLSPSPLLALFADLPLRRPLDVLQVADDAGCHDEQLRVLKRVVADGVRLATVFLGHVHWAHAVPPDGGVCHIDNGADAVVPRKLGQLVRLHRVGRAPDVVNPDAAEAHRLAW